MKLKNFVLTTICMILSIQLLAFGKPTITKRDVVLKDTVIEERKSDTIKDIDIDWYRGEVKILKSDNNEIKIIQKAVKKVDDKYNFTSKIEDEKLKIYCENSPMKRVSTSFNNGTVTITYSNGKSEVLSEAQYNKLLEESYFDLELYLPQKQYDKIYFNSDNSASIDIKTLNTIDFSAKALNGNVSLSNVDVTNLKTDTVNGSFEASDSKIENLNIDTVNGYIDMKTTSVNKDFNIDTVNSYIDIYYDEVPKNLKVSTVNGHISLYMPDNDGFNANIERNKYSSEFYTDFDMKKSNSVYTYKNGGNNIGLSCTNGDINIYKNK